MNTSMPIANWLLEEKGAFSENNIIFTYIFIPQNCIEWGKELTIFPLNTSDVKVTETLVGRTGRRLGSDYLYSPSLSKTYFNEK